jgi:hypothetical protein
MRRLACVTILLGILGLADATPARTAGPPIRIWGDSQIGRFRVKTDGTLFGAMEAFGEPTSLARGTGRLRGWNACVARWRPIGLRIVFYNLGGQNPCEPQYGYFRDAVMTGRQWRTVGGLRIGDPWRRIFRYYPHARPSPVTSQWWWLIERRWPYGDGGTYGGLSAKILRGWVVAFQIYYQAGGE